MPEALRMDSVGLALAVAALLATAISPWGAAESTYSGAISGTSMSVTLTAILNSSTDIKTNNSSSTATLSSSGTLSTPTSLASSTNGNNDTFSETQLPQMRAITEPYGSTDIKTNDSRNATTPSSTGISNTHSGFASSTDSSDDTTSKTTLPPTTATTALDGSTDIKTSNSSSTYPLSSTKASSTSSSSLLSDPSSFTSSVSVLSTGTTIEPVPLMDYMALYVGLGVAGAVVLIAAVVIIVIFKNRRPTKPQKRMFSPEHVPLTSVDSPALDREYRGGMSADDTDIYMNTGPRCHRIAISMLGQYVAENAEAIKQEYKELPSGDIYPCTVAKRAENKGLNRFQNIHPYDRTRVILSSSASEMESDVDDDDIDKECYSKSGGYINASYIDGYSQKRRYIATQGPLTKTITDFWNMVWTENSSSIVMLTSFVEEGKRKCEEYYPKDDRPAIHGGITVQVLSHSKLADYKITSFKLTKGNNSRVVHHFHYLSWPDHGVPSCYSPFLLFRHKVLAATGQTSGPIVVHCSAGIGRTGAYIAVDWLLEEALDKDSVDVYATVTQLRNQRPNMVQNQDQYLFIYGAVLNGALTSDLILKPSDAAAHCANLSSPKLVYPGKTALQREYELVCSSSLLPTPESEIVGSMAPENLHKNRDNSVPALDIYRPFLSLSGVGSGDYINAVFCNSYRGKSFFIATQVPLPHTIDDFWHLLVDHDCHKVILTHKLEQDDQYWPALGASLDTNRFTVKVVSEHKGDDQLYTVRDLELVVHTQQNCSKRVQLYELHFWPATSEVPNSPEAMLAFAELVSSWQAGSDGHSTVVQCMNGSAHCGLFIAAVNVLDRLRLDQEVDVFHTVDIVKIFRPQFVSSEIQYEYLYTLSAAYQKSLQTYSNFPG